eukprot:2358441-Pleurochrysis_carterae.AAC.1
MVAEGVASARHEHGQFAAAALRKIAYDDARIVRYDAYQFGAHAHAWDVAAVAAGVTAAVTVASVAGAMTAAIAAAAVAPTQKLAVNDHLSRRNVNDDTRDQRSQRR